MKVKRWQNEGKYKKRGNKESGKLGGVKDQNMTSDLDKKEK